MKGVITPRGVREESAKVLEGATAQLSLGRKNGGGGEKHVNGTTFEPFGRELAKKYWRFEEGWVNLNHGESACVRTGYLIFAVPLIAQKLARFLRRRTSPRCRIPPRHPSPLRLGPRPVHARRIRAGADRCPDPPRRLCRLRDG